MLHIYEKEARTDDSNRIFLVRFDYFCERLNQPELSWLIWIFASLLENSCYIWNDFFNHLKFIILTNEPCTWYYRGTKFVLYNLLFHTPFIKNKIYHLKIKFSFILIFIFSKVTQNQKKIIVILVL